MGRVLQFKLKKPTKPIKKVGLSKEERLACEMAKHVAELLKESEHDES